MGNDFGKGANRMAVAAMANVVQFDRAELMAMQKKFRELAGNEGNPNTITRAEFKDGLDSVGIVESDREILDRLFTMLDKTGDNQINFKEFVVGISPLITGETNDKLSFAFEIYDLDGSGQVRPDEMKFVLTAMNNTCSYFGDIPLSASQITDLVDSIYRTADVSGSGSLPYSDYMVAVGEHPILTSFISNNQSPSSVA